MADKNSPDIQKIVTDALTGVPGFLKSGLADNLRVVQAAPTTGYSGHSAIASIADNDPNTIRIHEADVLRNASPAQRTALLAHELTHRQMDQAAPGIKFQPVNPHDPYFYQERELAGTKITDWSPEQLARMVETNTAYQNDPSISAGRKKQVAATYQPILSQLSQLPQATIDTQQPAGNQINTTANAPAGVQFDSAPLVQPVEAGATNGPSDWEDMPQKGSGVQTSDTDWEDVPAESYMQHVNAHAGDVLKGAGKGLVSTIIAANPAMARGFGSGGDIVNTDSTNGAQTAGKVIEGAGEFLGSGGAELLGSIPNGVRALTSAGKARMGTLLDSNISSALHSDLGSTLSKVAQEAGVEVEPTDDVRKVVGHVATAIREKAQAKLDEVDELFKGLSDDDAPAGLEHYSDIQNAITKKEKDLNMLRSSTPAKPAATTATGDAMSAAQKAEQKAAAIRTEIQALKGQKATADAALDAQGLQGARKEADQLFEQADALDKLRKAHAKSTFGGPGSGQTNPAKFNAELSTLHDSGDLHAALGEDHAQNLMDSTGRAARLLQRNEQIKKVGGKVAGRALEGAGLGLGYELLK